MKSVRIRSYSSPCFPAFGLNPERYSASLHIQSKCEKMLTRITPEYGHFLRGGENVVNTVVTLFNRVSFKTCLIYGCSLVMFFF